MSNKSRAYLELHIAVLLFGLTAILGALISISAVALVAWRVVLASLVFLFIVNRKEIMAIPRKILIQYALIGSLVALHWICFYGAIKLSNASITLVCMATSSFFTSLIEPAFFRSKVKWKEVTLGLLVVPGMFLVVNGIDSAMLNGIWLGLAAALLAAIFASWNKKLIEHASAINISFVELMVASAIMLVVTPLLGLSVENFKWWPQGFDWIYILILVILCTNVAYLLSMRVLTQLSAFATNLIINLEPVYGIVLAWLILSENEELKGSFYLGCVIIVGVILLHGFLNKKKY